MSTPADPPAATSGAAPHWPRLTEPGLWVLIGLVIAIFFLRLGERPLRHEEPHRGQVGLEMMNGGDWIVPHEQGVPYLSRPPMQNWLIATCARIRGEMDEVAIRLPSALAAMLTILLIYGYAWRFLGPLGAFAGAAAYATMGQILELGTKGETESVFALFVAGSLLPWHAAASIGPVPLRAWVIAYFFVGLGTLTKGPQAPAYFGAAVGLYLIVRRRWRELLRPRHFVGLAVFAAVVLPWLVPFWLRLGTQGVTAIFGGDVGLRFADTATTVVVRQLLTYPLLVIASILPWSVLLGVYLVPAFRRRLGSFADAALFLAICLAVSFPTCWLPPGSKPRYFMPLYPCFGVLVGAVIARSAAEPTARWARPWCWFRTAMGLLSCVAAGLFVLAKLFGPMDGPTDQPAWFVAGFAIAATGIGVQLVRTRRRNDPHTAAAAVAGIAIVLGLIFSGILTNVWLHTAQPTALQARALRQRIPANATLYSFGWVDPVFVHYYGKPVEYLKLNGRVLAAPPQVEYFCFSPGFALAPLSVLQFPYELMDVVYCDFNRVPEPEHPVYVGRVLRD